VIEPVIEVFTGDHDAEIAHGGEVGQAELSWNSRSGPFNAHQARTTLIGAPHGPHERGERPVIVVEHHAEHRRARRGR